MPDRRTLRGHLALALVQVCFGLFPIFGKWAFEAFEPGAIASWRIGVGSVVLLGLAFLAHGRRAVPRREDWVWFLVCGVLGVALNQGLYLTGLSLSTAVDSGIVLCLIPVFTFAVAMLARQEGFRLSRALGILVALSGASILTAGGADLSDSHRLGNALMVANSLSYSVYLVLSRPLALRYPPVVVIAWVYACALPAVPLFLAHAPPWPADATPRACWSLVFILAFPTVLGYLLNVFALSRLRASTTAVYVYAQPLITCTAAAAWLGEELPFATLGAAVLIFSGLYFVARRPPST